MFKPNEFIGIEIKQQGLFMVIFLPGVLFTHLMWGVELLKLTDTYYKLLLTITLSLYAGILVTGLSILVTLIFLGRWHNIFNELISGINESKFFPLFFFLVLNTIFLCVGVILFKGMLPIGI